MKIDLVYTWVNGSDKEWIKRKSKYTNTTMKQCRFNDNDELIYSLRSVEKYASWINKIFIVTDNQIPIWLDITNPKIEIVDHKDIIPNKYLLVYNSNLIEMFIQNIKGLSQYYIYSNDDCLFYKKLNHLTFLTMIIDL